MAANAPPDPARYITSNDDKGESFFSTAVSETLPVYANLGGALQRLGYTTDVPPVQLSNNKDLKDYEAALTSAPPLVKSDGGANVWYIDVPPESESPVHRTISLDIVIQVFGELDLTLSNNETRTVKPGDMVIQRATLHRWNNKSKTEWARMVGVMSATQPVVTKGDETLSTVM